MFNHWLWSEKKIYGCWVFLKRAATLYWARHQSLWPFFLSVFPVCLCPWCWICCNKPPDCFVFFVCFCHFLFNQDSLNLTPACAEYFQSQMLVPNLEYYKYMVPKKITVENFSWCLSWSTSLTLSCYIVTLLLLCCCVICYSSWFFSFDHAIISEVFSFSLCRLFNHWKLKINTTQLTDRDGRWQHPDIED